jgi:serine protease AprX
MVLVFAIARLGNAQGPIPGTWLYDQNENKVDDRIESLAESNPDALIGMIVDFRYQPTLEDSLRLTEFGRVNHVMQYIPSISLRDIQPNRAFTLAEDMNVVMIELDEIGYITTDVSVRAIRARPSEEYSPNTAWEEGFGGQGINIAILDTGVDDGHPSLDDMDDNPTTTDPKFVAGYDATANPRVGMNPDDDNNSFWNGFNCVQGSIFHGTHVAGIALGTGGGTDSIGVAPEAKLIDVKVVDSCGSYTSSDLIAGIEWCIKNRSTAWRGQPADHYGIDVLNLSLGSRAASDGQDAASRAVNKAVEKGLIVVVAVGNDNQTNHIPSPAAADGAIAVGSVNDQGTVGRRDDIISSHPSWGSNRGPRDSDNDADQMDELKPDVTAYGSFITSAEGIDPNQNGTDYHKLSGTSMATPHVSGVCAFILSARPNFLPHDVKNLLRSTAEDRNGASFPALDQQYDVDFGWGIVDAHAAVTTPAAPPDLWISREPRWWLSKDIWLATDPPDVGQANTINARINNTSVTPASGVTVDFRAGIFGTGQGLSNWLWQTSTTINVPGTGSIIASVPWTPAAALLVKGPGHPCIQVEIVHTPDPNISNNIAQKNIKIQGGIGSSTFTFRAWNPVDEPKRVFFGLDRFDLPEGWHALFGPDGLFDLDYGDSVDLFAEVFPSRGSVPGDRGTVRVSEFFRGTIEPVGGVAFSLVMEATSAKLALPDTFAAYMDTIFVPVIVSTDSAIGLAQFVVDYDTTVARFIGAQRGRNTPDFSIISQPDLPFPPSTFPETNKNVLVQLSGGGLNFFTGHNQQVAQLSFTMVDSVVERNSPLIFDRNPERTFLTTARLHDIGGDELAMFDGALRGHPAQWPVYVSVKYDLIDPPRPVPEVEVTLDHSNGGTWRGVTGEDGRCEIPAVPRGEVNISFSKTEDKRNAITGADALLTLRHLAFLEQLNEPHMKAADVTLDTIVTGADAMAILRYLAFFSAGIAHAGYWEFIAGTPVPIPIPIPPPEEAPVEFSAYLLGDVTLNWGEGLTASGESTASYFLKEAATSEVSLHLGEVEGTAGKQVLLPVALQTNGIAANTLILTAEYDPACLEYRSALKTKISEHFMMVENSTETGKVHIAMAGVPGINKNGNILQMAFRVIGKTTEENTELKFSRAFINDLKVMNRTSGQVSFSRSGTEVPRTFQLAQNYPNPFNAETIIRYGIPDTKGGPVHVSLNIFNINGQRVRGLVDEEKAPGYHSVKWDGRDNNHRPVASGLYFYQMQADEFKSIKKVAVLK